MKSSQEISARTLRIGMPHVPMNPNHLKIHSLYDYVIFDDLLRPLVKFDSNGEVLADLALRWEITDNFKKFIFTLKENQFFSDGSLIQAAEVIASLEHLAAKPNIVHGDGKKIKKITLLDKFRFEIELLESDPFFLIELSAPEYRVVKNPTKDNYHVTSGPYTIQSNSIKNDLKIKVNTKYPFEKDITYKEIHFEQYDVEKPIANETLNKFDIIWPRTSIENDELKRIQEEGFYIYQMNLGFSFWFSLNPETMNLQERKTIAEKMNQYWKESSFFTDHNLIRSTQLFLPHGPGRMTEKEIKEVLASHKNQTIEIKRLLKVLLPKNIQKEIEKSIQSIGLTVKIDYYENFNEYDLMIKSQRYDILFVNNDLSSIDLRSSLIVTFNQSRPLVLIEKNNKEYQEILRTIKTDQTSVVRYQAIKNLGQKVLEDALVVPLYYRMGIILAKNYIDLSGWDKASMETSLWKIY